MKEEELTISLQEATYDYIQAFEVYERHRKFCQNDTDVYRAVLKHYFPHADITVAGSIITIVIPSDEAKVIRSREEKFKEFKEKLSLLSDDVSVVDLLNDSLFVLVKLQLD